MHEYETIIVIDSLLKSEEIDGIINKYERFISANGGDVNRIDRWGKKRLAYEIKKRQYGYYVYIRYSGPSTIVKPLEREFRLNESILRYLTIRLDAKMLREERRRETQMQTAGSKSSKYDREDDSINMYEEPDDMESHEIKNEPVLDSNTQNKETDSIHDEGEEPQAPEDTGKVEEEIAETSDTLEKDQNSDPILAA